MKTILKGLILALVIQFALFLPFETIFLTPQSAHADEPTPVSPTNPSIRFVTTSTGQQTITLKINEDSPPDDWTFTLQPEVVEVRDFYNDAFGRSQVPFHERDANNEDVIRKYRLTTPTASCAADLRITPITPPRYTPDEDYESSIYLITVKYTGQTDFFLQSGVYRETQVANDERLVKLVSGDFNPYCPDLNDQQKQILRLIMSGDNINIPIRPELSESDRVSRCDNTKMRWDNMVDNMRKLMIPAPSSTPGSSETGNQYWVHRDAVNVRWLDFGGWAARALPYYTNDFTFDDTYDYTLDLGLTDEGQALYDEIADYAKQIKTDIDMLRQAYPGNSWPDGCAEIEKFKWVRTSNPGNYESLDAFNTDFDIIYQKFKEYIAARDEPISTGGDDICGNTGTNLVSGKIFQWLFCELANIIHGAAGGIMKKATSWLQDSIGVGVVEFVPPADNTPATDGGGTSATPSSGDSGTGGTDGGGGTRTATPMDITGVINIPDDGERSTFQTALTSSMSAYAKNGTTIINARASCIMGEDGKSTKCHFTTTDNIPVSWTTVTIYGMNSSNNMVFRIMLQYPPEMPADRRDEEIDFEVTNAL